MSAAVRVSGLSHRFAARRGAPEREALKDVSFEAPQGGAFGVLGPNGGGKTTLFRILTTFLAPQSGSVAILGLDARTRAAEIRPRLGVVFQQPSLDSKLTVAENMRHQGRLYGLSGGGLSSKIASLLERYGLADRAGEQVQRLSGGLKRRVELAKSLLHDPEVLVLDEPSTGLDPGARRALWEHLAELKTSRGLTLLVTTHLMDEADRCDRLIILDRGRVETAGTPSGLKSEIGGDVISITAASPSDLQTAIKERFGLETSAIDGTLRLERREGHAFIPQLVEAFPGMITSVSLGKPTLEDVFIRHTGHRLGAASGETP